MSELGPHPNQKAVVRRLVQRLSAFALGLGLYEGIAQGIIEKVVADMPNGGDEQIMAAVRMAMLMVSA
ncbi:hypothetical protein WYO_3732 [Methylobacterium sp. GXF4]|uniref:hypothetical protein n=1 Tax=Methylobacterium sp. GXF4 TaxID=1096546 RepID=UPI0002698356|nr:hypothetical protein [Methylobacterium sp. GXF4]EIZ83719.1 hypothetical protein WYO_3732 [Methylobacterium sp. GXF4]